MQLYGPVRQAPNLAGALPNAEHAASSQQLATSQQFAACLATPFTGELSALTPGETADVYSSFPPKTVQEHALVYLMQRAFLTAGRCQVSTICFSVPAYGQHVHIGPSQGLADDGCFSAGTDKNMGEILRSEVDKMDAERELQTQLRYIPWCRHVELFHCLSCWIAS